MDVILPAETEKERSDNEALVERRAWARASIRIESFLFFFLDLLFSRVIEYVVRRVSGEFCAGRFCRNCKTGNYLRSRLLVE